MVLQMDMLSAFQGSYFSEIFSRGWDIGKVKTCVSNDPGSVCWPVSVPNWSLISCYANTIGPGIIFGSDYCIGGEDGTLGRKCSGRAWAYGWRSAMVLIKCHFQFYSHYAGQAVFPEGACRPALSGHKLNCTVSKYSCAGHDKNTSVFT